MELVSEENCKKRRRTKNTSPEQYELYLNYLESDYYFRSNTMNPTLGDNYLKDKWKELSDRLNSLGQGPCLSVQEWMKVKNRVICLKCRESFHPACLKQASELKKTDCKHETTEVPTNMDLPDETQVGNKEIQLLLQQIIKDKETIIGDKVQLILLLEEKVTFLENKIIKMENAPCQDKSAKNAIPKEINVVTKKGITKYK
ncbi:hypothetical protein NQ317_019839 [Molorchus minor]|uniref:Regulatory protein zeste n=1 Tax=Molorchus minor TaxID=1323400 RepID=A0ABQ9J9N8_9CUCU|nr:hypothetical protein NQ317_019839 [Molorchus minor]